MKKILYSVLLAVFGLMMYSCDDGQSYADQRDMELSSVSNFIANPTWGDIKGKPIKVISEEEFLKDTITDVAANEFVKFNSTGIYMQIVNRGCGEPVNVGESATVISRYTEYNVTFGYIQYSNQYSTEYDKYEVHNTTGTFSGTFSMVDDGTGRYQSSMFYRADAVTPSVTVPRGWLEPFPYIRIGRPTKENENIAKVRLIVPHEHASNAANNNVFACYYEISYERGI